MDDSPSEERLNKLSTSRQAFKKNGNIEPDTKKSTHNIKDNNVVSKIEVSQKGNAEISRGRDNEPDEATVSAIPGSGEREKHGGAADIGVDSLVDVEAVIIRFQQTRRGLKARTKEQYAKRFRYFNKSVSLSKYSKRQLKGKTGRELILRYLDSIPARSRRCVVAFLRPVWVYGLQLDWPIDQLRDLDKQPPTKIILSPENSVVNEWAASLAKETDIFVKTIITLGLQFGWRPSHIARIKWGHILSSESLNITYLLAEGADNDFKTNAPIIAYLPESTLNLLNEWKAQHPNPKPDAFIFPWRGYDHIHAEGNTPGQYRLTFKSGQRMDEERISGFWMKFAKKWHIPPLTPRNCRHWVATTTRRAGLSAQAAALIMGHDISNIQDGMRAVYDTPHINEWLQEQTQILPKGCLGTLETQQQITGIPKEVSVKIEEILTKYTTTDMALADATSDIGKVLEAYKWAKIREKMLVK